MLTVLITDHAHALCHISLSSGKQENGAIIDARRHSTYSHIMQKKIEVEENSQFDD
jgi:hypothetical protein